MADPVYDIPPDRKLMYYGGMALMGCGFLLFLSNFCMVGSSFTEDRADFDTAFKNHGSMMGSMMFRGIGGMVLIVGGTALMNIGAKGWAGAGVVLDPRRARKEREPWNRATGGMVNDALEEIDVLNRGPQEPEVKVRCRACSALSDESAKFCSQCGKPV